MEDDFIPDDQQNAVVDDFIPDDFTPDPEPNNDETKFRDWYKNVAQKYNLNPNPDSPDQFYDYRAAFKANALPDTNNHWPSEFKKAGHPNEIVGGFNTRTGLPEPGHNLVTDVNELVKLGWDPEGAKQLVAKYGQPKESFLSKIWRKVNEPLTEIPSEFANSISQYINPNRETTGLRGIGSAYIESLGNVANSLASPLNLATMGASTGEGLAAKYGMPVLSKALEYGTKALSAPVIAHGASEVLSPNSSLSERLTGGLEVAGGLSGFRNRLKEPTAPLESIPNEPPSTEPINLETAVPKVKPKIRLHVDGTATDLNTGELIVPPKPLTKTSGAINAGSMPDLGPVEMPPKLTIKQPTLANVSQAVKDGYKYSGQNPDGSYQFEHVGRIGQLTDVKKSSNLDEAFNFPRAVMASMDMSAPLRQGLGLIHKKQFWTSLDDMFKAWGSEEGFRQVQDSIAQDASGLFKPREFVNSKGVKVKKSIAEQSGLALMDLTDLSKREEAIASTWAEKIPGVRRSNRAYTAFLNKLRADTFKSLVKDANVVTGDINTNRQLTKELATFINTATGRGDLGSLEKSAATLNRVFFSPRLIASRLNMLDPRMYIQASSQVRKEALKSLFAIAAVGNTVSELGKMAGGTVENDPASSDFRKLKIGNVRVDPFGGFQQYIVLANRLMSGRMKSSTSGKEYNLSDNKFGRSNRWDVASRFAESKLNPALSFAVDLMKGKDFTGQPFNIPNELAERVTPIIVQDLVQLATENPELLGGAAQLLRGENLHPENLPFAIPSAFGMGIQQYDQVKRP